MAQCSARLQQQVGAQGEGARSGVPDPGGGASDANPVPGAGGKEPIVPGPALSHAPCLPASTSGGVGAWRAHYSRPSGSLLPRAHAWLRGLRGEGGGGRREARGPGLQRSLPSLRGAEQEEL